MTTVAPTIYDDAMSGELLEGVVDSPPLDTSLSSPFLWALGGWKLVLPVPDIRAVPELQLMARQVRSWTGWSTRKLAGVVGTTHTTIQAVENGRPLVEGRSGNLRQRLTSAYELIERVYLLAGRDADQVAAILDTAPPDRRSPVDELRFGDSARAYLAVVDVLRPRRPGLIVGNRPRRGGATAPLHE